jgi:hypothetical protein
MKSVNDVSFVLLTSTVLSGINSREGGDSLAELRNLQHRSCYTAATSASERPPACAADDSARSV